MSSDHAGQEDILGTAARWCDEDRDVALATVIATWGSSPRPVGSQLVADGEGHFEGSVSGGCIEGAVIEEARKVMGAGRSERARVRRLQRAGVGGWPRLRRHRSRARRAGRVSG